MEKETAMKILKELHDKSLYSERTALETIVPELKESEDERMFRMFKEYLKGEIEAYTNDCRDDEDRSKLKMFKHHLAWLEKQGEQKQEWSEEDEEMTEDLIKGCISAEKAHHLVHTSKEIADWLISLKNRMQGKEE